MKRDRIEIEKSMIPYNFNITLGAEIFNFEILYNETQDLYTVTLSKDDEVIVYDEPVIYGMPLFGDLYQSEYYPIVTIVPLDESEQETEVTKDNFNETVFLTIDELGDDE